MELLINNNLLTEAEQYLTYMETAVNVYNIMGKDTAKTFFNKSMREMRK